MLNQSAVIKCRTNNPFDYCWFQNPSGQVFSVIDKKTQNSDNDDLQYNGNGFQQGQCGVKIKKFQVSHVGKWKCGVGLSSMSMKEAVKMIHVSV